MSTELDDARKRATAAYAAADCYDDAANTFWARFGQRTIDRLDLVAGGRVLDLCCGSGASALPPAQRVAPPNGSVIGIDLSARLFGLARKKAARRGLSNAEFRVLGSGFRVTIDQLDPTQRERVRASNFDYIHRAGIRSVEANVVYAIATKPR